MQYAEVAFNIWGPNIASLKGKTVGCTPESVQLDNLQILKEIRELHHVVTLSINIFFITNISYFLTLSWNIIFVTVTHLTNRQSPPIFKAFIFQYYPQRGFQIIGVTGDGKFAPLQPMWSTYPEPQG